MDLEDTVICEFEDNLPSELYRHFIVEMGTPIDLIEKLKRCDTNLIAFIQTEPVGFVSAEHRENSLDVYGFYIIEEMRGRGIGKHLLRKLLSDARKKSIRIISGRGLNLGSRFLFGKLREEFVQNEELKFNWSYRFDSYGNQILDCSIIISYHNQTKYPLETKQTSLWYQRSSERSPL